MLLRWVSALIGAAILFCTTYFFGSLGVILLSSIIVFICMWEFASLFSKSLLWSTLFVACSVAVYLTHIFNTPLTLPVLIGSFVLLAAKGVFFFSNQDSPNTTYLNVEWTLWGIIYCALLPALALQITYDIGWKIFYFLLGTVFLGDSCALFIGMLIGGKKIVPKISPKKTVSGAIGGLLGSCLFGVSFMYYTSPESIDIAHWISICATIAIFAQSGDFFESMIKRYSGKKDTSQLMPGHGGFLDRVDGVYFGSVVLYLYSHIYNLKIFFL